MDAQCHHLHIQFSSIQNTLDHKELELSVQTAEAHSLTNELSQYPYSTEYEQKLRER